MKLFEKTGIANFVEIDEKLIIIGVKGLIRALGGALAVRKKK